jgi:hypothetical protein
MEIDREKAVVDAPKIKNVSHYHSIEFLQKEMKLYRYYDVGEGERMTLSKVTVYSGAVLKMPFSTTSSIEKERKKVKFRQDRQLCTLLFCPSHDCSATFESYKKYEEHLLSDQHTAVEVQTPMDLVRSSYLQKMKCSSMLHLPSQEASDIATIDLEKAKTSSPSFVEVSKEGWALPVRSNFRFSQYQKKILYKLFLTGEETGRKVSPEDAEMEIRKQLDVSQYVTSQQIKSLFSRWSKKLRNGTLLLVDNDDNNDEMEGYSDANSVNDAEVQAAIHETTTQIIGELEDNENQVFLPQQVADT